MSTRSGKSIGHFGHAKLAELAPMPLLAWSVSRDAAGPKPKEGMGVRVYVFRAEAREHVHAKRLADVMNYLASDGRKPLHSTVSDLAQCRALSALPLQGARLVPNG